MSVRLSKELLKITDKCPNFKNCLFSKDCMLEDGEYEKCSIYKLNKPKVDHQIRMDSQ